MIARTRPEHIQRLTVGIFAYSWKGPTGFSDVLQTLMHDEYDEKVDKTKVTTKLYRLPVALLIDSMDSL